jgi:hypothetical protein
MFLSNVLLTMCRLPAFFRSVFSLAHFFFFDPPWLNMKCMISPSCTIRLTLEAVLARSLIVQQRRNDVISHNQGARPHARIRREHRREHSVTAQRPHTFAYQVHHSDHISVRQ